MLPARLVVLSPMGVVRSWVRNIDLNGVIKFNTIDHRGRTYIREHALALVTVFTERTSSMYRP